jgi:hypothetical protein
MEASPRKRQRGLRASEGNVVDNSSSPNLRLLEALEACRPGSDDISDPALADLAAELARHPELEDVFGRLQKLDATLAGVFEDVPVPDGLANRLLARLAVAKLVDTATGAEGPSSAAGPAVEIVVSAPATVPAADAKPRRPKLARRMWWLAAAGSAAACVVVAVSLLRSPPPVQPMVYTPEPVLDDALALFREERAVKWSEEVQPLREFPLSSALVDARARRWRYVDDLLGTRGVAYDLTHEGGPRATLYVARRTVEGLPDKPRLDSAPKNSGGCCVWAWQQDGLVYALVVEGAPDAARRQFLEVSRRGPLA